MLSSRFFFIPAGLALAILNSCGKNTPPESTVTWFTADYKIGMLRGHEDLTRFAVERANAALSSQVFSRISSGEYAKETTNPLLQGNHATDFPDRHSNRIKAFYGSQANSLSAWHDDPNLQSIHFLRNFPNNRVASFSSSCHAGTDNIIKATLEAQRLHKEGNGHASLYFLGHATHIVQDSFAPAHARRSGALLRTLTNICAYGKEGEGACQHPKVDFTSPQDILDMDQDRPWRSSFSCQLNPDNRSWECLTEHAQAAARAATGVLVTFARFRDHSSQELHNSMLATLKTASDEHSGYFACP